MGIALYLLLCTLVVGSLCNDVIDPDETANPAPAEVNEGEEFIQGDIYVGKGKGASNRNAIKDTRYKWVDGKVCYRFNSGIAQSVKDDVRAAIADFHKYSCLRFTEDTSGSVAPCIRIYDTLGGCFSMLGCQFFEREQKLNLDKDGCKGKGVAIHELLHAVGFNHEQNRDDRDSVIRVAFENVKDGKARQFELREGEFDTLGYPYDCNSVMHYGKGYFSKNGKDTMIPYDSAACPFIGNRKGFTKYDLKKLRKYYKCAGPEPAILSATGNGGCAYIDGASNYCQEGYKSHGEAFCYAKRDTCSKTCICDHPVSASYKACADNAGNDVYSNCFDLLMQSGKATVCAQLSEKCPAQCRCTSGSTGTGTTSGGITSVRTTTVGTTAGGVATGGTGSCAADQYSNCGNLLSTYGKDALCNAIPECYTTCCAGSVATTQAPTTLTPSSTCDADVFNNCQDLLSTYGKDTLCSAIPECYTTCCAGGSGPAATTVPARKSCKDDLYSNCGDLLSQYEKTTVCQYVPECYKTCC